MKHFQSLNGVRIGSSATMSMLLAAIFSANIRFRYNFREGQDLWIVFNEGLHTDRHRLTPTLPPSQAESLLVKYIHTFQW